MYALVSAQWSHMVPQLPIKTLYVFKRHMIAIQRNIMLLDTSLTVLKQPGTFDIFVEILRYPQLDGKLNYLLTRRSHFVNSDTTLLERLWQLMQIIWVTEGIFLG